MGNEVIKGLEGWAEGKYWGLQSRRAETKKGGDGCLKRGEGKDGDCVCDHKILGYKMLKGFREVILAKKEIKYEFF